MTTWSQKKRKRKKHFQNNNNNKLNAKIHSSCHAKPAVDLTNGYFCLPLLSILWWLGQGVRSPNKRGGTLQSLPHFHSADMISWQRWPLATIRHGRSVAFHNGRACKTRWPHFPLPVQGSYPPHEKAFHHKPRQPLLNRIYKYFTEAERSGGDTSDKSVNHVPPHLSSPPFFTKCLQVNSTRFQAFLQTPNSSGRCKSLTPYLSAWLIGM